MTVWQRDAQSTNSDVSYKGMPYFMSSMGYSVLLNTFTRTHFNMGMSSAVSYTMETEDPYLDYFVFLNRDYKGLLSDYTAFSGRSEMIPRWAFGFWRFCCCWSLFPAPFRWASVRRFSRL